MCPIKFIFTDSIPPFHFLAKIIQTLARAEETTDMRELIHMIKQEPSTAAKILHVTNSAAYMSSKEISSIESAAALLGLSELKYIVLGSVIAEKFDTKKCPNFDSKAFWLDSVLTGENTEAIYNYVTETENLKKNDVYCVGLLNTIGILFLVNQFPQIMNDLLAKITDKKSLSFLVKQQFEINEYQLTAQLLAHWGLPKFFSESTSSIRTTSYHGEYLNLVNTLRVAKKITQTTLLPNKDKNDEEPHISLYNLPGLSTEHYTDVSGQSEQSLGKNAIIAEALCR